MELSATNDEHQLREKLARIVMDEMYQFVALLDRNGRLLDVNRAALEGAGMRLDDLKGKPFWEARWWRVSTAIMNDQREACRRAADGAFVRYDVEVYGEAAGEDTIIIDYSLVPVTDQSGAVVFLLAEGRNISEKKRAEAEVARKNQELELLLARIRELDEVKSQFFANVSHELRTPLALMLGPTERMLQSGSLTQAEHRDIEVIRKNAFMLLKHVNDLLDVAKLDAGQMGVDYQDTDLAALVRSMAGHFEALAPERSIRFLVRAPDSLPAQVDGAKIERVVLNLLSNAFKFTPTGGRIVCSVEQPDDRSAVISVQDSGPGVPLDMRGTIFERFRQADGGATRQSGGTGLGLAVTKEFAELHGGTISVADAPAGGALFQVSLPLSAPEGTVVRPADGDEDDTAAAAALNSTVAGMLGQLDEVQQELEAPSRVPERSGAPLVLVVEDNADLRRFMVETLHRRFDLKVAADGRQGLEMARTHHPDVILTDIMMPHMSGDQMVEAIRRDPALADTPVLVLSAKADDALRIRLLARGAQDYVVKPFSPEELTARVSNLADVKRARDVLRSELNSRQRNIETLAKDLAARTRDLARALDEARVARQQAETAASVKSRFLGMASHELRSPLQIFALYLEVLKRSPAATEGATAKAVANLSHASQRMTDIVNTILEQSAVESGKINVSPEAVDLRALMADVVADAGERAVARGQTIVLEPGDAAIVDTDRKLMRLVLVNLIENAIKHADSGTVTIAIADSGAEVRCTVADPGPGIAAANQTLIFQPFEQLGDVRRKHTPGVGLGLSLVKSLLEALGGWVELDSEPGRGSRFTAVLPRTARDGKAGSAG
ncbi:multi-sensor signal transduction histidine kinase [Caenispirillum salinarum AK4]|uniref:histidine kinase n=1 Tax=Caenispirillum salinarum AK4 TaxID=1238182 RepID=K9GX34_9PROT|nr:multi-sensor signal transduction histidine kinase [Caenispirillum salinarum AK4]